MERKRRIAGRVGARRGAMAWWILALALAFACRSALPPVAEAPPDPNAMVLNSGLPPIELRYGLGVHDIELGILLAIAHPPSPPALDADEAITDRLLQKIVGRSGRKPHAENPWYFRDRSPGLVDAGYERGEVTMRVAIMYDDQMILLRIVDSRNLGQTRTRIRAQAFMLLQDLDARIRESILAVAQRNEYGAPLPASYPASP